MGLMDKAMDKALAKLDDRFGELRVILLDILEVLRDIRGQGDAR